MNEEIEKLLELAKKCRCLRCGECCFGFGVHDVPGYNGQGQWTGDLSQYGFKPDRQRCRHLVPAQIVDGVWQRVQCRLHDSPDYPWECNIFALGISVCPLGQAIWQSRLSKDPNAKPPED